MLNDAKFKSSLTLILETPKSNPSHSYQRPVSVCFNEHLQNNVRHKKEMNPNQLPKSHRTLIRSESLNDPLLSNETIIPIKYLSHDANNYDQQNTEKSVETSPKYCCTLEVKFVWYDKKNWVFEMILPFDRLI